MSTNKLLTLKHIELDKRLENALWILSINNPPVNTLSKKLFDELEIAIDEFSSDHNGRVMILTAIGDRAFASGVDINEILALGSPDECALMAQKGQNVCNKIECLDKPVIVAINGMCIGGGNEIALACHLRIASERAKFGQPEVNLGIIPGFGGTQRLPRLIGESKAKKLILTGDLVSAQEALQLGLIDMVVKPEKLIESAIELAKRILRNSQVAIKYAQQAIREGLNRPLKEGLKREIECFKEVCKSEDMREGLKAYKEKRVPNYKHH